MERGYICDMFNFFAFLVDSTLDNKVALVIVFGGLLSINGIWRSFCFWLLLKYFTIPRVIYSFKIFISIAILTFGDNSFHENCFQPLLPCHNVDFPLKSFDECGLVYPTDNVRLRRALLWKINWLMRTVRVLTALSYHVIIYKQYFRIWYTLK